MQSPEQSPGQLSDRPWWQFKPGQSGNPSGKSKAVRLARRDGLVAEWAAARGGVDSLTAAERSLLRHAAELSLSHPRTVEDRVRVVNTVRQILSQTGLVGHGRIEPASSSLRDRLL